MEFVLVGALLTVLTLGVLQLGIGVYVRNVVHDAAVEGAHVAALADATGAEGVDRTRVLITRAVGAAYAEQISVRTSMELGHPTVEVSVAAPLPIIGLLGIPGTLEVSAHAPLEVLD